MKSRLTLLCILTMATLGTRASGAPQPYVTDGSLCDGFPRAGIEMAEGACAGIVIAPAAGAFRSRHIKTPRFLLALGTDRHWLISDLGGWTPARGKIWRLEVGSKGSVTLTEVIAGLSMPHTLTLGPDGRVYVGEMGRIFRFDPHAAKPATSIEVIIDGLPDNRLHEDRHPLSHFIFDRNHDLLVNVGAATDQCATRDKQTGERCAEDGVRGVVRRHVYLGKGRWSSEYRVIARGLRNSMVLARHESGTLLQVENSYDFAPEANRPHEEINVLREGAHYGWPYCWDVNQVTAAWRASAAMDCNGAQHEKPIALLPPHSAPLAALYYDGPMFPQLRGKLLLSLHGYRPSGSRVVAINVDARGIPHTVRAAKYANYSASGLQYLPFDPEDSAPEIEVLTSRWDLQPGVRPAGAPVGLAVAQDGSIWLADDRNAAILRIAADKDDE